MSDVLLAVAGQEGDDGPSDQVVATRLLTQGGTGGADEHLAGERGVVDAHIELEELVLRGAAHTLAGQVHAVAHVDDFVHRRHEVHVRLIGGKIGLGQAGGRPAPTIPPTPPRRATPCGPP